MVGNVIEFKDDSFQADVLDADVPVLVDFWAPWCGPCKLLGPTIEELANDYEGKAKIGKMNTDECTQTATTYQISSIPTVMIFKNGEIVDKLVGVSPKAKFVEAIDKQL